MRTVTTPATPSLATPRNRPAETASGLAGAAVAALIWVGLDPVVAGFVVLVAGFVPAAITWLIVTWRTAGKS